MGRVFFIKKTSINDFFIIAWAAALSVVTLSQGANSLNLSFLMYPIVFLPFVVVPFVRFELINTWRKKISIILLFFLIASGFASAGFHGDMAMVYSLFAFSLLLLSGLYIYPALFDRRQQVLFFNAVFCFSLAYFLFFSFQHGLVVKTSLHYANKNTLGIAAASIAILGLGLFFSIFEHGRLRYKILYMFGVAFMIYLTLLSVSRTAALSVFMVFLLLSAVYFFRANKVRKLKFSIFMTLIALVSLYAFGDLVFDTVIEKFQRKEDDVFDNRSTLWQFILANTGFLGLGMDFFRYDAFIAAHSTYFSFLGRYGWSLFIPFLLLLLFLIWDIFYKLVFKRGISFDFILLALFSGFLLMSIAEIMIYKSIMVYGFIFIGGYARAKASPGPAIFKLNGE